MEPLFPGELPDEVAAGLVATFQHNLGCLASFNRQGFTTENETRWPWAMFALLRACPPDLRMAAAADIAAFGQWIYPEHKGIPGCPKGRVWWWVHKMVGLWCRLSPDGSEETMQQLRGMARRGQRRGHQLPGVRVLWHGLADWPLA
jgi:hypothetical protein